LGLKEDELEKLMDEPGIFKKKKELKMSFKDKLMSDFMSESFVNMSNRDIMRWLIKYHLDKNAYLDEYQMCAKFNTLMSKKFTLYSDQLCDRLISKLNVGPDYIHAKPQEEVKVRKGRSSCPFVRKVPEIQDADWVAPSHRFQYGGVQEDEHVFHNEELNVN